MIKTQEIPSEQWASFFDHFSRLHKGQPVRVATMSQEVGVQMNARNLPLIGVVAERLTSGGRSIEISVGQAPDGPHVSHTVDRPARVYAAEWSDDRSSAVDILSADGWATLIQVGPSRQTLRPGFITDDILKESQHTGSS